jgi:hypothetical protein
MLNADDMVPTAEAAVILRQSHHTLNSKRSRGEGPPFVKSGGRVFYLRSDLEAYILARRYNSTAEARAGRICTTLRGDLK